MHSASALLSGISFRGLRALLLALGASFVIHSALAATVILTPSKDNTLYEDTEGNLSNGQGAYLFAGKTGAKGAFYLRRGLLAFDIAFSVPAGATVTGVSLTMFMSRSSPDPTGVDISLHLALSDWGEGGSDVGSPGGTGAPAQTGDATWIHNFYATSRWTNTGGDFADTASATTEVDTADRTYTWDGGSLVDDVQGWVNNPGSNFGWFILGNESLGQGAQRFNSSESNSNVPQLTITYAIPEPSCIALCLAGGAICLHWRRNVAFTQSRKIAQGFHPSRTGRHNFRWG